MILKCENINYNYGKRKVINNVSLGIKKGQFTGIVGDNGSGKSTLMKILSGILFDYNGKVFFENEELNEKNRIKIGYIFQNPENQIVGVTIEEDVAFGMENMGVPRKEMIKKIQWALSIVGMSGFEKRDPNTLSGGQKQRLAIASILAMDPEVIFMDEPTTMLDPVGRLEVYTVIKKLVELKKTVVIASHHSQDLRDVERIIALKNGKIIFDGNKNNFYKTNKLNIEEPIEIRTKKILHMNYEELVNKLADRT
ncbi:energy-coupling factor transporter ATP-binding protein EcfA1 [Tepiditoga spiralis]|uniref:Energy-coupling factor transporter ATP-binding protein EcfA1 n=1 Tax=Tepiditoga spiralis TaxID=2108365 RepID=A0A7G1G3U5_9BACT|nr:ATP-binding cassette domain-containing protein [Tepiditoga spiralis]BBE29876.1 energy-coupling factor transporter ATP-binding protein EcfA1 [Tepiditoga spiralis]